MTDLTTVLDFTSSPGGGGVSASSLRHPIIAWQNLLASDDATLTVSSEATDFLAINVLDGKEYTYWKTTAGGTQYIEVEFPSSVTVNFLALHGHDLHIAGGFVVLERWTGAAWVSLGSSTPTTGAPIMITFPSASGTRFRVLFGLSGAISVAIIYMGQSFQMERGCWQGMTPPWMGRITDVTTTKSEAGVLLGRSVRLKGVKFDMDFANLTIPFVRNYWMPFVIGAEESPFFVMWNPQDYPTDVAFCWVDDPSKDFQIPRLTNHSYMSASVSVHGRVDGSLA